MLKQWPVAAHINPRPSVSKTGAWILPKGYEYRLDACLAEGVAQLLNRERMKYGENQTLLDMGAGKGLYVRYWRSLGIDAHGVEGAKNIANITKQRIQQADLTQPFAAKGSVCKSYSWVTSFEVAEHIPAQLEKNILANLNCSARNGLIISWAKPGQHGIGHVNVHPEDRVVASMRHFNWMLDQRTTKELRRAYGGPVQRTCSRTIF